MVQLTTFHLISASSEDLCVIYKLVMAKSLSMLLFYYFQVILIRARYETLTFNTWLYWIILYLFLVEDDTLIWGRMATVVYTFDIWYGSTVEDGTISNVGKFHTVGDLQNSSRWRWLKMRFENEHQIFDSREVELINASPRSLPYLLTSSPKFVIIN